MKRIFFAAIWAISLIPGYAQYGNEWIQPGQVYFKIPIAKNGLYKLTYTDLQNAGFPTAAIDPRRLQIFHRGAEQAIHVEGQTDGQLNAGDYIEFYGRKNDGTQDVHLYKAPELQPHTYYNLYNDTTAYFLTYNPLPILGKRMEDFFEVNVSNTPKETYHIDEKLLVISDSYSPGMTASTYLQSSVFDAGEGWTGLEIRQGEMRDYQLSEIINGIQAGGNPELEVLLVGRGTMNHQVEISAGANTGSLRVITTRAFSSYHKELITASLNWTDIAADGRLVVRVRTINAGSPDRVSVSYVKLRYPQQWNAAGSAEKIFEVKGSNAVRSYIEISNASGMRLFDVTDPSNIVRIGTTSTTTLNAMVEGSLSPRKIYASNVTMMPTLKKVSFRSINPVSHDYIIISHKQLMKPALGYSNVVKAYAEFRASEEGGSYDTLIIDINQLYDQFNYGETSPLAIKRFMKFLINTRTPKYLFLIGKGLDVSYRYYRNPGAAAFSTFKDLVPTAGSPASDIFFTAGLSGVYNVPAVPTGRITATTPTQVANYLNKVKEMEGLPYDNLWRKNILHLSGGINAGEPELFRLFMEGFKYTAESYHLGGNTFAIAKQSTDLKLINVSEQVNKGVNLITFFGHSSPSTIDFDIGYVTDPSLGYNNAGRYPMLLINGCNAGSFFSAFTVFGEDWIHASNKGAIGFMAHSSYGLVNTLKRYSDLFYEVAYGDSVFIRKGVGDIQKELARRYMDSPGLNESIPDLSQVQQMILLGDPAVRVFGAQKPDLEINDNNLFIESFDGNPVTALTDSFALNIIIRNFGIAKEDTIRVNVQRTFTDNSTLSYDSIFPATLYQDTLQFIIRKDRISGFGNNSFKVTIDADSEITELNEGNNVASLNLFIPLNGTKNLFPHDYAIVNKQTVDLKFQTTDLLSGSRDFILEVDTVQTFNSAYKKSFALQANVLGQQAFTALPLDSLAYYWRTKLANPLPGESEEWVMSSFTYINNGPEGWAQVHFPQYLKNEAEGLVRDPVLRELKFEETLTNIFIRNFGSANTATNVSVRINNSEHQITTQGLQCRNNTINLVAFNKVSTAPYPGIPFGYNDPRTCGRLPQVIVSFAASEIETGGDDIIKYINNIQIGDPVILFSIKDAGFTGWSSNVKNKLGELGISTAQINALQAGEPIVIVGKKGGVPGSAVVHKTSGSPANMQELQTSEVITGHYSSGIMQSVSIGPAQQWISAITKLGAVGAGDVTRVDIKGVDLSGNETELMNNIAGSVDLSAIDANDYPYLRLVLHTQDEVNLTPTQLNKWLVLYTPLAEGILFSNNNLSSITLQEGEMWSGSYGFTNISEKLFPDSLNVQVEVFNKNSRLPELQSFNIKSPLPGDTTFFAFDVQTTGKSGLNDLDIFVNPRIVPEQYYENNVIERIDYFNIWPDKYKPVLDVTIDGRQIQNEDFVSSDPTMLIRLWDESRVVLKKDTLNMNIFLQYPCGVPNCPFQRISFSDATVAWKPATSASDFQVTFTPKNLIAGTYTLRVEAHDGSGNTPGPYDITFQVTYESVVRFLAPHPNPSTHGFTFSLLISGAYAPQQMDIDIIALDGKRIHHLEWIDLHVGMNELFWDGQSGEGMDLPGGMYLYKLTLKEGGSAVSVQIPSGSSYLNGGYGKLVLVR